MCSEKYGENLVSYTTGSHHASAEKRTQKLTLFEDLLENSDTGDSTDVVEDGFHADSCPSDCESGVSGGENDHHQLGNSGNRGAKDIHGMITKKLVSSLNSSGFDAKVEGIRRIDFSSFTSRAKLQSFCIYSRAVEMKCNGDANVKYAWFGASKTEINSILSHGFCLPTTNGTHGYGIHLSPVDRPVQSMPLGGVDEDGLMHMLLCRVIMGKMEAVSRGSNQYNPSSEEFDSGVDDLASPGKYIVWSSRMNTHILPEYVLTFRAEKQRSLQQPRRVPNSEWMPFPTLIAALGKFLPRDATESISKLHSDYRKQKVTRHEMIQRVRHIAGDNMLMAIIKSYRTKKRSGSNGNGISRGFEQRK